MNETHGDSLNNAILESRKQLQKLQETLQKPDIDYTTVLQQVSQTSDQLKQESEIISNEKYLESSVLPIAAPKKIKKNQNLADQIRAVSPKEYTPFRSTHAYELKKKFAARPTLSQNKPLPKLTPSQQKMPAYELVAKGIVSESDDLSTLIPDVTSKMQYANSSLFTGIHIDFKGAAEAYKLKKEKQRKQEQEFFRKQQQERAEERERERNLDLVHTPTPQQPLVPVRPPEDEKPQGNPRIYEELQDAYAYQTLLVVRGKVARETPDFESFQRTNRDTFESIDVVLNAIEGYCAVMGITYCEIDGRMLSQAAKSADRLTYDIVARCLIGIEDAVKKRQNDAATLIKKNWKVMKERQLCKERKRLFWAARTIQEAWRNNKVRREIMKQARQVIASVDEKSYKLSERLRNKVKEIEQTPYVAVHVITSMQDIIRVFDLIYSNASLILVLVNLPPPHIWEDFLEFMAYCGIDDVNERVHYVIMRDLRTGNNISNKLLCDTRSVSQIKRLIANRTSFIVPHFDWHAERRLSVDIGCPILGVVDTNETQSRGAIKDIFGESGVVFPLSTREHRSVDDLFAEMRVLMDDNRDLTRWVIHLGFTSTEDGVAWFDATKDFYDPSQDIVSVVKKNLHCKQSSPAKFLQMIPKVGACVEAVPTLVRSFPSVSLLITGDEIRVLATYDRIHYQPFRFGPNLIPCVSVDPTELIRCGRQVGTSLLKHGVLGYVAVDFLSYREGDEPISIVGFDIRVNSYPHAVMTAYATLCAGFEQSTGKLKVLRGVGDIVPRKARYAIIHNGLTHPGLAMIGSKELKQKVFSEGLIFDLLQRTGFTMQFFDAPCEGKSFSISCSLIPENALTLFEKAYSFILKILAAKVGSDDDSTIASSLIAVRHFKSRIYP